MNKSHKRKLPIGWRRLTPTEKIDETCRWQNRPFEDIRAWCEPWQQDMGQLTSFYKNHPTYIHYHQYIFIKPIKQQPNPQ